jgi:hypothetical protein
VKRQGLLLQVGCGSSYCPGPGEFRGENYPYSFVVICQYLPPVRSVDPSLQGAPRRPCRLPCTRKSSGCGAAHAAQLRGMSFTALTGFSRFKVEARSWDRQSCLCLQGNVNGPDNYILHVKDLKAK